MEDKRKYNGGNKNAGRKPKADEQKVNTLFVNALKELYNGSYTDFAIVFWGSSINLLKFFLSILAYSILLSLSKNCETVST
jgi:hypothetical protein